VDQKNILAKNLISATRWIQPSNCAVTLKQQAQIIPSELLQKMFLFYCFSSAHERDAEQSETLPAKISLQQEMSQQHLCHSKEASFFFMVKYHIGQTLWFYF